MAAPRPTVDLCGDFSLSVEIELEDREAYERIAALAREPIRGEVIGGPLDGLEIELEQSSRSRSH